MRKPISAAKARRIARGMPMPASLEKGFIQRGWQAQVTDVYGRAAALLTEHADASPALRTHLHQLLPTIAFYEAAIQATASREAALAFMDEWAFVKMRRMLPFLQALMKTGLYRLMPALCAWMLPRMFGANAGFDYRPAPDAPKFSVDMTRCPYVALCGKYGVPELTGLFCRSDDLIYGNLHPRLLWARTETLGAGGSRCDFRLHLKEGNSHDHR